MKKITTYKSFLFIFIMMLSVKSFSQKERSFDENSIEDYRNNPKYQYDEYIIEDPPPPQPTNYTRTYNNSSNSSSFSLGSSGGILFILVLVILVGFLIYQYKQGGSIRGIKKKQEEEIIDDEELIKQLTLSETDQLIQDAIDKKQYRRAVRLLYLASLKMLFEKGHITWLPNKTNSEYAYEIKKRKLRSAFRENTNIYDYIWYGERDINQQLFEKIFQSFKSMNSLIN